MSFLDRFRKKQPPPPEERSLSLEEVKSFYSSKYSSLLSKQEEVFREFRTVTLETLATFPLDPLDQATFSGEKRLAATVNMAKATFLTKIRPLVTNHSLANILNPAVFKEETARLVEEIKNANPKQSLALSHYFKNESAQLVAALKTIDSSLSSYSHFMENEGVPLSLLEAVDRALSDAQQQADRARALEKEKHILTEEHERLNKELKEAEADLSRLVEGEEWKALESREEMLASLEQQRESLEFKIRGELAILKRPLKKAKHTVGKAPGIDSFISEPFTAFLAENGEAALQTIMTTTLQLVEEGKLSLKGTENEKLHALDLETLSILKNDYQQLLAKKQEGEQTLKESLLPDQKEKISTAISLLKEKVREKTKELDSVNKRITSLQQESSKTKTTLEKTITATTGDKITVV